MSKAKIMDKSKEIIKFLWKLLDDIDTTSDMAKDNDKWYRKSVEMIQKKRWETGIKSGGYTLDLSIIEGGEKSDGIISPIIESDCAGACKTVVESYEGDGMENMDTRDRVMYDACKKALENHSL